MLEREKKKDAKKMQKLLFKAQRRKAINVFSKRQKL